MDNELSFKNSVWGSAFSSADFVLRTQQQLAKDFRIHGFDFGLDFDVEALEMKVLFENVRAMLSRIVEEYPSKWLPLMYSLDISEQNYRHFFAGAQSDWLPDFTRIVIRREAQKVFFREKLR